jgi:hypothetical protein
MRPTLAEQVAELERIYRARQEHMLRKFGGPRLGPNARPLDRRRRDEESELLRRQARLLAAWQSLAWLAEHPDALRGYLHFAGPFVRHSPDWTEPPEELTHDVGEMHRLRDDGAEAT